MKSQEPTTPASITTEETQATLTKLIAVLPSTSYFAGWGPRMNGPMADVLKARN